MSATLANCNWSAIVMVGLLAGAGPSLLGGCNQEALLQSVGSAVVDSVFGGSTTGDTTGTTADDGTGTTAGDQATAAEDSSGTTDSGDAGSSTDGAGTEGSAAGDASDDGSTDAPADDTSANATDGADGTDSADGASGADDADFVGPPILPDLSCALDADCDDGLFCTGTETCVSNSCHAGTPPCDSSTESCQEESGLCLAVEDSACTSNTDCAVGLVCDIASGDCVEGGSARCGPGAGSCYVANFTPGCESVSCCDMVCQFYPTCCNVSWDEQCAEVAFNFCALGN